MSRRYSTRQEAIDEEILPYLGEHASDYDIDAIADEALGSYSEGYRFQFVDEEGTLDTDAFNAVIERNRNA